MPGFRHRHFKSRIIQQDLGGIRNSLAPRLGHWFDRTRDYAARNQGGKRSPDSSSPPRKPSSLTRSPAGRICHPRPIPRLCLVRGCLPPSRRETAARRPQRALPQRQLPAGPAVRSRIILSLRSLPAAPPAGGPAFSELSSSHRKGVPKPTGAIHRTGISDLHLIAQEL